MGNLVNSSVFAEHIKTPEEKLWKAVLSQGVYEACSEKAQALPLTYGEVKSALEWIDLSNRDFIIVCIFAGYNPGYIYRKAKYKIKKVFNGS
mgnify:CR=1 FL=1